MPPQAARTDIMRRLAHVSRSCGWLRHSRKTWRRSPRRRRLTRLRRNTEILCEFSLQRIDRQLLTELLQTRAVAHVTGLQAQQDT
jgi:hypothetical protein